MLLWLLEKARLLPGHLAPFMLMTPFSTKPSEKPAIFIHFSPTLLYLRLSFALSYPHDHTSDVTEKIEVFR